MHNNVEKYNLNSDDNDVIKISKVVKKDKIEEVLINNITKQINKIETITLNRTSDKNRTNNKNGDDRNRINDDRNRINDDRNRINDDRNMINDDRNRTNDDRNRINDDRNKINDDRNRTSNGNRSHINTYKICNPQIGNIKANKKYVGLIFVNNDKKSSFITLTKNIYIINYYITIMINDKNNININNYFCSLGIKNSDINKISIIKGSKNFINIKNNLHSEFIIIKDTIIYEASVNQEICLITDFNKKCKIVEDKSIIKIVPL
jgi:hypothetical protein